MKYIAIVLALAALMLPAGADMGFCQAASADFYSGGSSSYGGSSGGSSGGSYGIDWEKVGKDKAQQQLESEGKL